MFTDLLISDDKSLHNCISFILSRVYSFLDFLNLRNDFKGETSLVFKKKKEKRTEKSLLKTGSSRHYAAGYYV